MSALCNPTLPLGLGDDEFSDDLQALMPGSPFDLLLGTSGGALLDLSKVTDSFLRARAYVPAALDILPCVEPLPGPQKFPVQLYNRNLTACTP